jgi:hypothetical protein
MRAIAVVVIQYLCGPVFLCVNLRVCSRGDGEVHHLTCMTKWSIMREENNGQAKHVVCARRGRALEQNAFRKRSVDVRKLFCATTQISLIHTRRSLDNDLSYSFPVPCLTDVEYRTGALSEIQIHR